MNYSSSFTAGALLYQELVSVIEILKSDQPVMLLNKEKEENQFLKIKTESARTRIITEIKRRFKYAPKEAWFELINLSEGEQRLLLFYVLLKAHPLARDYQYEVVLKKWKRMQTTLNKEDLEMRLEEICSIDEEVDGWSDATKTKTMTQFIRVLREAGLMRGNDLIKPKVNDPEFWNLFLKWGDPWFLESCLLTKDEIAELI